MSEPVIVTFQYQMGDHVTWLPEPASPWRVCSRHYREGVLSAYVHYGLTRLRLGERQTIDAVEPDMVLVASYLVQAVPQEDQR